jgi:DNA-binding transcriptional ArsR family regulator
LLGGRALTATELAYAARVSPQTTSGHLAKLAGARLVEATQQGRHRYYRLAGAHVGQMLESILNAAAIAPPRLRPIKVDPALQMARMCYDHLAGRLGVGIADALCARGDVMLTSDGGEVTTDGIARLRDFGIEVDRLCGKHRAFCRPCLDWIERRPHLAGALGAAIAQRVLELGWVERTRDSRALTVTPTGHRGLSDLFGVVLLADQPRFERQRIRERNVESAA